MTITPLQESRLKTQIKIESVDIPYCVIHTKTETQGIKDIAEKISRMDESGRTAVVNGWDGDYCIQVKQSDIFRIYSADKKVYMEAQTGDTKGSSGSGASGGTGSTGSGNFGGTSGSSAAHTDYLDKASSPDKACAGNNADETETLLVKMRLYEFEELAQNCGWTDFIRISNTDIVNFSKVTKLDMSLSGIIRVNFTNGKDAMVSRRYMNKIKDQLNMVRRAKNA